MINIFQKLDIENIADLRSWVLDLIIKILLAIGIYTFVENAVHQYYTNVLIDLFNIICSTALLVIKKKRLIPDEKLASVIVYYIYLIAYLGLISYILEVPPIDFQTIFYWIFPVIVLAYIIKPPNWALSRNIAFFLIVVITIFVSGAYPKKITLHNFAIFAFVHFVEIFGLYMFSLYVQELRKRMLEKHKKALENEQKLRTLAENAPIGIVILEDGKITYMNKYMYPLSIEEKKQLEELFKTENLPQELSIKHKGQNKKFLINSNTINFDGKNIKIITLTDITEEIKLRKELEEKKQFFETITEKSPIGIVIYTENVEYANPKFLETLGYSEEDVVGKYVLDFIPDEYSELKRQLEEGIRRRINGEVLDVSYVIPVRTKSGLIKWLYITAHTIKYKDSLKGMAVIVDITEKKMLEEKIFTLENLDLDTGLPNRKILIQEAESLIKQNTPFAIIAFDINDFLEIRKIYGKDKSTELIKAVVERLQKNIPGLMLGKVGLDRLVIIKTFKNPKELSDFINNRLLKQFEQPFQINSLKIPISINVGISLYPQDGETAEKICSNAEFALRISKLKGKKEVEFFSKETENLVESKLDLVAKLREALEKEEFKILYQPKVYLKDFKFAGCEALLRWEIPPSKFLPVMTEEKMLTVAHRVIFAKIFNQIKEWLDKGLNINVAINLPFSELEKKEFLNEFFSMKNEIGVPAKNITIEITETEIMQNPEESIKTLRKLKDAGFSIAIDDFGVGYSSLSYLADIPADELKIDISFVKKLPHDRKIVEIVKIIVDIGKTLNMKITAEGIETKEQLEFLKQIGCDIGQGFYISKPLTAKELENFYKEHT